MGTPIEPGDTLVNTCPAIFGVDNTPEEMLVTFSGITPTPGNPPGMLTPPNWAFIVTSWGPCQWRYLSPTYAIFLEFNAPNSSLWCTKFLGAYSFFTASVPPIPTYIFTNEYPSPANPWFGDGHAIVWYIGASAKPTVQYFLDLFNIEANPESHADQSTNDPDLYFTHIKRLQDDGFIKAKISYP